VLLIYCESLDANFVLRAKYEGVTKSQGLSRTSSRKDLVRGLSDTTDHRNIQKQMGAMQEKYGRGDQTFTMYKKNRKRHRTTVEQERYNEVRKKQRQ
jgi:hypothetical protein